MTFAVYYSWLATQADPLHARLAQVGIEDFAVPPAPTPVPVKGPTLKQLLGARGSGGRPDGDRRRRAIDRDDSRVRSVPLRERRGEPVPTGNARSDCRGDQRGPWPRHGRRPYRRSADSIAHLSRQQRALARARRQRCQRIEADGSTYLRGSRGGASARHSPSHPGPIRRVGRAIAGSKSFTSAKANRRRRG